MMTAICTCKWRFQYCVQRSTFVFGLKRKNKFNRQENCNWTYDFLVLAGYLDSNVGTCYQRRFKFVNVLSGWILKEKLLTSVSENTHLNLFNLVLYLEFSIPQSVTIWKFPDKLLYISGKTCWTLGIFRAFIPHHVVFSAVNLCDLT